jgi:uncharacterized protein YidB (DUF937 family)
MTKPYCVNIQFRRSLMGFSDKALDMVDHTQEQWIDPKARLVQAVLGMLSDNGQAGGLHGLIERFQEAGLDNLIRSWIGPGRNLPISSEQIHQVLDRGYLRQIGEETGLTQNEIVDHLSQMLPGLIDRFTPGGQVPHNGFGDSRAMLDQLTQ